MPDHNEDGPARLNKSALQFRGFFPFDEFNDIQTRAFPIAYESDENIILSAPTGSGKTVVMELCALRFAERGPRNFSGNWGLAKGGSQYKIIYLAPSRSLISERLRCWKESFSKVGVSVTELQGTQSLETCAASINDSDILLSTPEKWDSLYRRFSTGSSASWQVGLLLIDEIHFLGEKGRGAALEAVICRMKNMSSSSTQPLRIVACSATLANPHDIGYFLGCHSSCVLEFGPEFRPVPLDVQVSLCAAINRLV